MFAARQSRNIEASIVDRLTEQLKIDDWEGVRVEKKSANVYNGDLPAILVNIINNIPSQIEIGSSQTLKKYLVSFRIYASGDGQRLDLADWVLETIEDGIDYYAYQYKLENRKTVVDSKTFAGRINMTRYLENKQELETIENLATEDKHRHLITIECTIGLL